MEKAGGGVVWRSAETLVVVYDRQEGRGGTLGGGDVALRMALEKGC